MTDCARTGPVSLRIALTDRCQLRCLYCMPPEGVPRRPRLEILSYEEIVRFVRVVKRHFGLSKVHLTGGEPLLRPGVVELVTMLAKQAEVADLALTTNGQLLGEMARPLKNAGLKRVNVSLDSLDAGTFARLTRGGELRRTLKGLDAALAAQLKPVKINVTVVKNANSDEVVEIARFGLDRGCEVRFLELMPIGPAAEHFDEWFVCSDEVSARLSAAFDLSPESVQPGSSSRRYAAKDGLGREGVIGFISSFSRPFCSGCRRLRLTASGQLIGCLGLGKGPNIRPLLGGNGGADEPGLVEAIGQALCLKKSGRSFATRNLMIQTGG